MKSDTFRKLIAACALAAVSTFHAAASAADPERPIKMLIA